MFVMLGLLINPSSLKDVWLQGLLIALVLTLVARPISVIPVLKLFGFNIREITLVSWVGLRGSVPIILAIYPLIYGLPNAALIFSVVFFVVLISATVQGSTLPLVARKLGLTEPPPVTPAATLEITSLGNVDADIVEYQLGENSRSAGRRLSQLALPEGTVVAMITRGNSVIPPRGSTMLQANDHLFIVLKPDTRNFVDMVFAGTPEPGQKLPQAELRLKGTTRVEDAEHSYGISLTADPTRSLDAVLRETLAEKTATGACAKFGDLTLCIKEMVDQRITTVGLSYDYHE
jgi:cell volume regulation protein A